MSIKFVDYSEPTNTAPNVLAKWDEVREDIAAREEFINQVAAELQAMAVRTVRQQNTVVRRDKQITEQELLITAKPDRSFTRWGHFKAWVGF